MTTTATPVRVSSPGTLAAVLPHLMGFTPAESLVLVWMAEGGRITLSQRIDVEALDAGPEILGAAIAPGVAHGPDVVAAVIWSDSRIPSPDDVDALAGVLDHVAPGVRVLDVMHVTGQRWRSLLCDNPECCPLDGSPLDLDSPAVVELIGAGSAPLADRETVLASEPVPAGLDRTRPTYLPGDVEPWRDDQIAEWLGLLADGHTGEDLTDYVLGRLAGSLADVRVRDVFLWHVSRLDGQGLRQADALVCDVVRAAHPFDAAPALTVAGLIAWQAGDGVRARHRIDAALLADSGYSLAVMLDQAMTSGLPPAIWLESMSALTVSQCRGGVNA